ncbi:TetR/AcrR family transcriptional regulator [Mycobacterium sp. HUMS_1102779]|uniref:TetR/AcrR family transcriptional regulator n=1 Tax=Mycobacterium sp. HUMS_1102779 TaxID=3383487 RepID=UPI00389AA3B1
MGAVLTEAYRLVTEGGIGGVSVEEISRRSGVAKTTIYRHWQSRSALLLDACSKLGGPREIPDSGLSSIIDAAERDPDVAKVHAAQHAELMSPLVAVVERAQKRGELTSHRSAGEIVASLVGPLFFRRWFSKEPIDDDFVTRLLDAVTGGG